jgi:asparagine synthase (glutamine-hydrolysing)
MCCIAGIISRNLKDSAPLQRMLAVMRHRGPDDEGQVHFGSGISDFGFDQPTADGDGKSAIRNSQSGIHLGIRRLSIIDLPGGHQPMFNEGGTVAVVFNGEIYNFQDLRQELRGLGHGFRTRSDTEVIVHAYEEWGRACVQRLRGMFAFAIYDRRLMTADRDLSTGDPGGQGSAVGGRLFLARDRLGIKPLYYYAGDACFSFASQMRALLESGLVPRRLSLDGLHSYLLFGSVQEPLTLIDGVYSLPPDHSMTIDLLPFTFHI